MDLWYGTLGCWAASARSGRGILACLILSMNACARCALMSHEDPRAWGIRAIRKGESSKDFLRRVESLGWRHRGLVIWDAGMLGRVG